jgi:hypothetical protein
LVDKNSELMGKVVVASDAICRAANGMMDALGKFTTVLENRPCMFEEARRQKLLKGLLEEEN